MSLTNHNSNIKDPGIAAIEGASFTGPREPLFGDTPAPTTTTVKVGENVDLPIYSVVSYDGSTIALATLSGGTSNAYGILTAPVKTGAGESTTVDVYRSGHFDMVALNWDASFATDDDKKTAFEDGKSTTIFISKKKWNDSLHV